MKFSFPFVAICVITFAVAGCKKKSNMKEQKMTTSSPTMSEAGSQTAGAMNYTFMADLSGSHEVPTPVTTNASGKAYFKVNSDSTEILYTINLADADSVIMAHIHYATSTGNGPVLVWLYPATEHKPSLMAGPINGTLQKGVITDSSLSGKTVLDLIHAMEHDSTYVQVHTKMHPEGELRGQIQMK